MVHGPDKGPSTRHYLPRAIASLSNCSISRGVKKRMRRNIKTPQNIEKSTRSKLYLEKLPKNSSDRHANERGNHNKKQKQKNHIGEISKTPNIGESFKLLPGKWRTRENSINTTWRSTTTPLVLKEKRETP